MIALSVSISSIVVFRPPSLTDLQLFYICTAPWHRKEFTRIEQLAGIPGLAYLLHDPQIDLIEDQRHLFLLLYANAMFSGNRASNLSTDCQYLVPCLAHPLDFTRNLGIEEDERVQVAIACMKDIAHSQAIALADFSHTP